MAVKMPKSVTDQQVVLIIIFVFILIAILISFVMQRLGVK